VGAVTGVCWEWVTGSSGDAGTGNCEILGDTMGLELGETGRFCGARTGTYWELLGDTLGL